MSSANGVPSMRVLPLQYRGSLGSPVAVAFSGTSEMLIPDDALPGHCPLSIHMYLHQL